MGRGWRFRPGRGGARSSVEGGARVLCILREDGEGGRWLCEGMRGVLC